MQSDNSNQRLERDSGRYTQTHTATNNNNNNNNPGYNNVYSPFRAQYPEQQFFGIPQIPFAPFGTFQNPPSIFRNDFPRFERSPYGPQRDDSRGKKEIQQAQTFK